MDNTGLTPEQTQALLSILYDIAKEIVKISYYIADGAYKWHLFADFMYSARALVTGAIGAVIGYILGRR